MRTNTLFVAAATFLPFTQAYLENPPTTAASDTVQDCSYWDVATSSSTCANFATTWSISLADFNSWVRPPLSNTTRVNLIFRLESLCRNIMQVDCWEFLLH
jgi:hypothetical protein